jgi:uncharacterized protein (DUF433 family)
MINNRIEINPEVLAGKPIIKGTRISVEQILRKVGSGISWDIIMDELDITKEDIISALKYAENVIANEDIFLESV